ncbi:Putative membrane protein, MmpL [Mycobacteroides abscessus subsp. abscessus]|nr:Putative membrane protein, MmpL [Mycobacteroides abscessus subsp. abscessus]
MLSSLAIAAGTDYAIFLIGRYQEARQVGQDRENAYYTMFRGTFHIILGSGLTIAGATLCLHLARLSYFKALGIPSALGLLVVVVGALTAAPAVVVVAGRFGLLDPKRPVNVRRWRRIGTATVRWPGAVFAASSAIALIGIAIMPTMKVSYNDRFYIPEDLPSNIGYTAAERHFSSATMNPDILMIESDHDMRNTGDMIILDRIAKEVFRSPGIAMVQSITRPLGGPIEHTSIPFQISAQSIPIQQNLQFMKDRAADMLSMSKDLDALIGAMERMQSLLGQMSSATHRMSANMTDAKTTLEEIRDHLADFDDVVRPLRNYFYWEQHRFYIPEDLPSNIGYTAAERHFSSATMNPDILMIESDHDMRNTGDMIILDRIAKEVFRSPGIAMVQSITRPLGGPIEHTSIPFQISAQSIPIQQNLQFMKDRAADMLAMSKDLDALIGAMERMQSLLGQMSSATHRMSANMTDAKTTLEEIRDHLADFDDVVRPLRNYFYWEQHCFDLPACSAIRSVFDALDGVDAFSDKMRALTTDIGNVDAVIPQMAAQLPPIIAVARSMQDTLLTMHSSFSNLITQMAHMTDTASAMGQAFDASRSGDYFYLPPEAFQNPDFQRGLKLFLSPDGTAARFIITHDRDPATPAGISTVTSELEAAHQAVKGTALTDAKFYLAGTAAIYRDIQSGSRYDLLIVGIAAVTLIFAVMMIITRAFVASLAIVGTVLLSLGAAFGISVLVWQHIFGLELNWIAPVFGLIILLAVGSDYNLLLVSRFQEEIGAGLKTGIIRSMGGTGGVVTSAGLVFAFTMMSMVASDLSSIGQAGSTIGLGLLFDTLIVRSLMTPSLAGLLGPWFWWPLRVRTGPTAEARPNGPRPYTQEGILNIATGPER